MNHGSTGWDTGGPVYLELGRRATGRCVERKGYIVAFPCGAGGKIHGLYDEGFGDDRSKGYTCTAEQSRSRARGRRRRAVIKSLQAQPHITDDPVLWRASRGRRTVPKLAASGDIPTRGVINFSAVAATNADRHPHQHRRHDHEIGCPASGSTGTRTRSMRSPMPRKYSKRQGESATAPSAYDLRIGNGHWACSRTCGTTGHEIPDRPAQVAGRPRRRTPQVAKSGDSLSWPHVLEFQHLVPDNLGMILKREVTGVQQVELHVAQITLVRRPTAERGHSPTRSERAAGADGWVLPMRIMGQVGPVIVEIL